MIEIQNISIKYNQTIILENFSYSFEEGKIYRIHGANGCGKSTLLKFMVGEKIPIQFSGRVSPLLRDNTIRSYMPDKCVFYPEFTAYEFLKLVAYLRKMAFDVFLEKSNFLFNLEPFIKQKIKTLSMGQLKKVFLCACLLVESKIVVLDEPFNGLDSSSIKNVVLLLKKLSQEMKTLYILTTHQEEIYKNESEWVNIPFMEKLTYLL